MPFNGHCGVMPRQLQPWDKRDQLVRVNVSTCERLVLEGLAAKRGVPLAVIIREALGFGAGPSYISPAGQHIARRA